jgi:hypothetical protein
LAAKLLAVGFSLLALAGGASLAREAASVVLVTRGGAVCAGGGDVIFADSNATIRRWHQRDGTLNDMAVPDLGHVDVGRLVLGCLVRPDGEIDLYYEEYYSVPGTQGDLAGRPIRKVQTIWASGGRHRVLLDIHVPEGGQYDGLIDIFPELGIGVYEDLTIVRASDGLHFKAEIPEHMRVKDMWPASRTSPVEPPALVICYSNPLFGMRPARCIAIHIGQTAMDQRPFAIDSRDANILATLPFDFPRTHYRPCMLKPPADFDCFLDTTGGFFASYPAATGYVAWRRFLPDRICRQRSIGIDSLVVQARCFRFEGPDRRALFQAMSGGWVKGYEYPSQSGWTMTHIDGAVGRPITVRLVPADD